jgi:alkylation response protein AidB-like acyl-CoA dehydrogenase
MATVHHEHLNDMPLNIDLRSVYFEAFEVYKIQEISEHWSVDKMKGIVEKIAKFSEKLVNQGKRDAERIGIIFRPGEEFKEKAVLAPKYYHKAWEDYYKGGFGRLATPRALGGLELPHGMLDYIIEIMSAGSPALGTYFGLTQGAALIVTTFGSDWMKDTVLPGLINGRFQGTMCLTEPQAGSDLAAVTSIAERKDNGDVFEISGTKIFITSGDHDITENHWHIVLAKIPGTGFEGTKAISLFLVPKFWVNEEGSILNFNDVETQSIEHKSGLMTSPTCVLKFNKSKGFLIGGNIEEEIRSPSGMKKMFFFMNAMRHETGTAGRGQAVATCLDALVYSSERKQGVAIKDMGKKIAQSTIIDHGNQKKLLLDMFARSFGDRALTQKLTELRDRSHKKFDEGMHKYQEKLTSLQVSPEQKKVLEGLTQKYGKVDRQLSKSKDAKKRVSRNPEELKRIEAEIKDLKALKTELRNEITSINANYLSLIDFKKKLKQEKEDVETYASIFTSLVKAQVTDDNVRTLIDGMQAYGGIGFMAETPVSQRLHDSQILCIWEGTNDIQSLNTVFRQIGDDVKDSKGNIIFLKVMKEMNEFLDELQGHHRLDSSVQLLKKYIKELTAFRNAMTVSTWRDKIKFMQCTYGFKLKPSKEESIAAKMKWGMMMQAVARNFNTYFSQVVQAWQLLRIARVASSHLDALKSGAKITFDKEVYDENFLEGRVLIARHFISSPACLDKNIFTWQEFFFNNAAVNLQYAHLADKPSRITMG